MKSLAIIALTMGGAKLASAIIKNVSEHKFTVFIPASLASKELTLGDITIRQFDNSLKDEVKKQYPHYDGFIMIMALGIVVRVFAPLINHKKIDPPVLCLDEKGQHVISVLSGHLGGANQLTRQLAKKLGANAVITTATDVNNTLAFDEIAKNHQLSIEPFANLKYFNSAMVHQEKVLVYYDICLSNRLTEELTRVNIQLRHYQEFTANSYNHSLCCLITNKLHKTELKLDKLLYLRPVNLIIGVGCRRNVPASAIIKAISEACEMVQVTTASIKSLATVEIKRDELGITAAAEHFQVPVQYFSSSQLGNINEQLNLTKSNFVYQAIGVEGVCEPAALMGGKTTELILKKTVFPQITIAIAQERSM
ncbi:MAG: cobalamin biosynthesis protein [Bacillota bacterium]|nr:cobalamin biosynthesis protein [Bacillota bacterium]